MIRLIATDMDGTFLDSSKQVNKEFFLLFEKLKQKDILFVIASGNQFYHLYNQFLPISDDLYFIAENGSYITKGKKELYCFRLENDLVDIVFKVLNQFPCLMPVICGKKKSYILKNYLQYTSTIQEHYDEYEFIEDLSLINDEILKFSIHDPEHHVDDYIEDIRKQLPKELKIMTSGNEWMDIQRKDIHKGIGIQFLQDLLHLKKDECAAFGDQMNDFELLQNVRYAYAMKNAVQEIKNIAYEVVLSNEEQGVLQKLKEILED